MGGSLGQFCEKTYHPQCAVGTPRASCTAPTNVESTDDTENYGDWVNYKCFAKKKDPVSGRVLACGKDKTETFPFCTTGSTTTSGGTTGSLDTSASQEIHGGRLRCRRWRGCRHRHRLCPCRLSPRRRRPPAVQEEHDAWTEVGDDDAGAVKALKQSASEGGRGRGTYASDRIF